MPLELLRESQSPRGAVCGNRGCFRTMHGSVSAPSCCSFTHRVAFEEVSGHRVLLNCGPGNQGRSTWGTSHGARLEFPRETGLVLRCAGNSPRDSQESSSTPQFKSIHSSVLSFLHSPTFTPIYKYYENLALDLGNDLKVACGSRCWKSRSL